jgi:hypothetical protein
VAGLHYVTSTPKISRTWRVPAAAARCFFPSPSPASSPPPPRQRINDANCEARESDGKVQPGTPPLFASSSTRVVAGRRVSASASATSPRSVAIGHYQPVGWAGRGGAPLNADHTRSPPRASKPPAPAACFPAEASARARRLVYKGGGVSSGAPVRPGHLEGAREGGGRIRHPLSTVADPAATLPSPRGRQRRQAGRMGAAGDAAAAGTRTRCELCGSAAAVHCAADSAFLCPRCDAKVHGANFLASRHVRRRLPRGGAESGASSSSGSCLSTADSAQSRAAPPPPGRGRRAEDVLEGGWARRKRVAAGPACRRRVPLRVAMAAARWSEVRAGGGAEAAVLAVAAWWMTRAARARPPAAGAPDLEEGWAECSPEFVVRQGPHPSAM